MHVSLSNGYLANYITPMHVQQSRERHLILGELESECVHRSIELIRVNISRTVGIKELEGFAKGHWTTGSALWGEMR